MGKNTKAEKAASAAVDAAAAAAKDAKRLSKTLPKKDAKKLRSLADEAKDASQVSKKKIARHPRKVEKKAVAAISRVEKAADKAESKLAAAKSGITRSGAPEDPIIPSPDEPAVTADLLSDALRATLPTTDLESLTVVELRDRARAAGHRGFSRFSKAQLIALLSS
jgi:hypothetical protein